MECVSGSETSTDTLPLLPGLTVGSQVSLLLERILYPVQDCDEE